MLLYGYPEDLYDQYRRSQGDSLVGTTPPYDYNGTRLITKKFKLSSGTEQLVSYSYDPGTGRYYSTSNYRISISSHEAGQTGLESVYMDTLVANQVGQNAWNSANGVTAPPPPSSVNPTPPPPNPNNTPRSSSPTSNAPPTSSYDGFRAINGSRSPELTSSNYNSGYLGAKPQTSAATIGNVDDSLIATVAEKYKTPLEGAQRYDGMGVNGAPTVHTRADVNNSQITAGKVNDYFKSTPMGSMNTAISQAFAGFNRFSGPPPIPHSKDIPGYTFFVRPQLNLQSTNIRNVRKLYTLLNESGSKTYNVNRAIRSILDPRFQRGYNPFTGTAEELVRKTLSEDYTGFMDDQIIDPYSPFIAILSNTIKSVSGWPDIGIQAFTSKPGLYNEMYTQVDSHSNYYEAYDIDVTFKNIVGDPVTYLFYIWITYASLVFEGLLLPYMDYIKENTIDYTSRIYRLVMDYQRRRVTKIMATGYCFPLGIPTGSFFDFDESLLYSDQNKDISIRFRCSGAIYNDEILIRTFNESSAIFNPIIRAYMKSNYTELDKDYIIVDNSMGTNSNYLGNPIINPHTRVLEWICHKDIVDRARLLWAENRSIVTQFT